MKLSIRMLNPWNSVWVTRLFVLFLSMLAAGLLRADDLSGIVKDSRGQPLPDVRIDISIAGPKNGRRMFCPSCYLDCLKWTKSDSAGRFTIKSLDQSLNFRLIATAPGKQTFQTGWVDPSKDDVLIQLAEFPQVDSRHLLLGHVTDVNGIPVPGALVSPANVKTRQKEGRGTVRDVSSAVTDDRGDFQMLLNDDFASVWVEVLADGSSGLLSQALKPGETIHELKLPTGTSIIGRLMADGKPAVSQPVSVVQLYRSGNNQFIKAVLRVSDAEGNFVFKHLPADQPYVVFTPRGVPSTGLSIRTSEFHAGKDDEVVDLGEIKATPGFKLAGRFVVDGEKVFPDEIKLSLGREPAWDLIEIPIDSEGRFEFDNLPQEAYSLGVGSDEWVIDERKANYHLITEQRLVWGLTRDTTDLEIPLRELRNDEPPLRQFRPKPTDTVAGRQALAGQVVDRSGRPVFGIRILPKRTPFDSGLSSFLDTGSDGKFSFNGLPDQQLILSFYDPKLRGYPISENAIKIMYMGSVRSSLNQKDLRIIYDPDIFMDLPVIK